MKLRPRLATLALALLCALAWLLSSAPAGARAGSSATEKAAAEALFDQALEHLKQQQYQQACPLLERSQRIDPAVGTLLYLAECYERTLRLASAWATFREAASLAEASNQPERAAVGAERAQRLEARLPRVSLEVDPNNDMAGFELLRDGEPVKPALFGIPLPLDPGSYELVARAPEHQSWQTTLEVHDEPIVRRIIVPRLVPLNTAAAAAAPSESPSVTPSPTPAATDSTAPPLSERSRTPRRGAGAHETIGWGTGTLGLIGVVAGVGFGMRATTLDDDAAQYCDAQRCWDERGAELSTRARRSALYANISYGVGGAALLTSLILLLTAPGDDETASPRVHVEPNLALRGGQVELRGRF